MLADDLQAELVQAGERGQTGTLESSAEQVGVFRIGGAGTLDHRKTPALFNTPTHLKPPLTPSTVMSRQSESLSAAT